MNKNLPLQQGIILPTMIFIIMIFTISLLAVATFAVNQFSRNSEAIYDSNALLAAEAGAEQTLNQLNQDNDFGGYASEQEFFNNSAQGRGVYQTSVTTGSLSNERYITSTSRVYKPGSSQVESERTVRLLVVGTTTQDQYAIHAGAGGIDMSGSATIANGPVYVNGGINMSGAARIGSSSVPVNVFAANYRCPLNSPFTNYPQLCGGGSGEPITANIWSNRIYGAVCATGQTTGSFMSHTGLQSGCVAPVLPLPNHDRASVTSNISSTQTGSQAGCGGATTKSWPANLHVTGSVSVGGSCTLTINGNVWIDGNFTINGAGRVIIANSVTTAPQIVVDGSGGVNIGGSGRIIPNTSNVAALVVTYYSTASCSPSCSDVTGSNLKTSENNTTVTINGAGQAPGTLFYARWTKALISGSGSTGGVIAQKVDLNGAGNVVFGTQLSSGTSVWSIKNYQQIFN